MFFRENEGEGGGTCVMHPHYFNLSLLYIKIHGSFQNKLSVCFFGSWIEICAKISQLFLSFSFLQYGKNRNSRTRKNLHKKLHMIFPQVMKEKGEHICISPHTMFNHENFLIHTHKFCAFFLSVKLRTMINCWGKDISCAWHPLLFIHCKMSCKIFCWKFYFRNF